MRLLLIRHGESEWNAVGRWQGQADPPLTSQGRSQARSAVGALGAVDAIWTSTLLRASQTAAVLADGLGVGPTVTDERLIERCAGEWEGLTRREVEVHSPGFLDDGRRPPGWEADSALLGRVMPALTGIALAHEDGDVAVVTHGGVIYAVESLLGAGEFRRIGNLGARRLEWTGDEFVLLDRIDLLGDGSAEAGPERDTGRTGVGAAIL